MKFKKMVQTIVYVSFSFPGHFSRHLMNIFGYDGPVNGIRQTLGFEPFLFNGGLILWYITIMNYDLINTMTALVLAGGVPGFHVILVMNFFRDLCG